MSIYCDWDKRLITNEVIECPVRFHPTEVLLKCTTSTGKVLMIKERIMDKDIHKHEVIHKYSSYDCVGAFCSFECCKAYIMEARESDDLFENSLCLLKNRWEIYHELHATPKPLAKQAELTEGKQRKK